VGVPFVKHSLRISSAALVFTTSLILIACGGGGGGSDDSNPPPAPTYTIGGTITGLTGTVVLRNNAVSVLSVSADGSFTFSAPVANGSAYNVAVFVQPASQICAVANGSGTVAGGNVTGILVTCTTLLGTAQLIETDDSGDAMAPQVAYDGSGNALAVWSQWDGARYNIYANRYSVATNTWGAAALIEANNVGDALNPQLAINASGDALVVWQLDGNAGTGVRFDIWANRYTATTNTWGTAAAIENNNIGEALNPQIAIDANGDAVAVWQQDGNEGFGLRFDIWANRYTTGAWSATPVLLETDDAGRALNPQVAIATNGDALVVWSQHDGALYNIWTNRYSASAWGGPALIELENSGNAADPQIAVDAAGDAIVLWRHYDGAFDSIWTNRYTATANTWGTAAAIESDNTGDALNPQLAIDAAGNAIAVWQQDGNTAAGVRFDIWANRYSAGSWGTPALIETNNAGNASIPQIAINATGDAVAVWLQDDGESNSIFVNRYTAGVWGTAALLEADNTGEALAPQIVIDVNGNALAVWQQDGNSAAGVRFDIWANRF